MRSTSFGLDRDAQSALHRETRASYWRSFIIAGGFALPYSIIQTFFEFGVPFLAAFLAFTIPMGLAMPYVSINLLEKARHRSFVVTIIRQTLLYMAAIGICIPFSMLVVICWKAVQTGHTLGNGFSVWLDLIAMPYFPLTLVGALLMVVPIRFLFALSQKLGPGVMGKWIRGYYHEPREEERIFMFLDMKDSTTLAEQLGNLKFSALVRDFFEDLTLPVLQTRCEVSHYIGDEAVLTWTMEAGIEKANCVRIFFEFEKSITRRTATYFERYGLVPGFKAGLHCGNVVATEVGEVKSEIVYHGDVLNTAARIQGLCNSTGERLLISDELHRLLILPEALAAQALGEFELKGKEGTKGIVAIREIESTPTRDDN